MARGKKKKFLTPEERLQATLVPESEQPYKVPKNWICFRFTSLIDIEGGTQPPKSQFINEYREGYIRLVQIRDFASDKYIVFVPDTAKLKHFNEDDILIARYGASLGRICTGMSGAYNVALAKTIFSSNILNRKYVYWMLQSESFQAPLMGISRTAQAGFNKEDLSTFAMPLPPLSEQQRIVNRIESLFAKLDEAKQKAQDALDSFETRKAAILHKAFTGELTAQWRKEHGVGMESWENLKIGTYAQVKGGKRLPKGHKLVTERTAHPYLRIADFGDGTINDSDLHYITEDTFSQIKNYIINKEDVYISIVGSIGKAGVIPESLNGANLTENAARIISSRTLPRYLSSFLSSPKAQNDIQNRIRSATLGKLSLLNIKDIETPVPSIEEQTEIVRLLDDLLAKEQQAKEAAEGVLEQIDLMKKAILARAFRGELGTNDPREESAVELLKQVL